MKTKTVVGLAIFLSFALIAPMISQAGPLWADCKVVKVGLASEGTIFVMMKDVRSGNEKHFTIDPQRSKEMLAMILTALSNDLVVKIYVDFDQAGYPTIPALYVLTK